MTINTTVIKSTRAERMATRNEAIRTDYVNMWNKHLRGDFILAELAKKYHFSEDTIYRIVKKIGQYKECKSKAMTKK